LHIVRHPGAIIAAQKRKQPMKNRKFSLTRELETIHQSMRYGLSNMRCIGNEQYYIVPFEDLVSDTENVMRGVAKFLDISYSEILIQPTVFGKNAGSNTSSFNAPVKSEGVDPLTSERWRKELPFDEVNFIEGFFGALLKSYSYISFRVSWKKTIRFAIKLSHREALFSHPHPNNSINLARIFLKCKAFEFFHKCLVNFSRKKSFNNEYK
jgi:hypothetical protein